MGEYRSRTREVRPQLQLLVSLAMWECCEAEGPGQTKSTGSERSRHSSAVERGGSACTVHTTPRNGRRLASAEAFPYSWTKGIHHVRNMFWTLSSRLLKSTPNTYVLRILPTRSSSTHCHSETRVAFMFDRDPSGKQTGTGKIMYAIAGSTRTRRRPTGSYSPDRRPRTCMQ